jgi:hypothetical protein
MTYDKQTTARERERETERKKMRNLEIYKKRE